MNNITKGNVSDILDASAEKMKISLLKKDFSGQMLKGINLFDSMIAKCIFKDASIYGSSFTNCDFVRCDFTSSDLYHVNFINCRLNECSFQKAKFDLINFDEDCKLNACTFSKIDLNDETLISGISPEDLHIVNEESDKPEAIQILLDLGFMMDEYGCYKFESINNPDTFVYVYFDTETQIYRLTCYVQGSAIFTNDLDDIAEYSKDILKRIVINSIKTSIRKIGETKDEQSMIRINSILNDFIQKNNTNTDI